MKLQLPEMTVTLAPTNGRKTLFKTVVKEWQEGADKQYRGFDVGFNLPRIGGLLFSIVQYRGDAQ